MKVNFTIFDDLTCEIENTNGTKGHSFSSLGAFIRCLNKPKNADFKQKLALGDIQFHICDRSTYCNNYVTENITRFCERYVDDSSYTISMSCFDCLDCSKLTIEEITTICENIIDSNFSDFDLVQSTCGIGGCGL